MIYFIPNISLLPSGIINFLHLTTYLPSFLCMNYLENYCTHNILFSTGIFIQKINLRL